MWVDVGQLHEEVWGLMRVGVAFQNEEEWPPLWRRGASYVERSGFPYREEHLCR